MAQTALSSLFYLHFIAFFQSFRFFKSFFALSCCPTFAPCSCVFHLAFISFCRIKQKPSCGISSNIFLLLPHKYSTVVSSCCPWTCSKTLPLRPDSLCLHVCLPALVFLYLSLLDNVCHPFSRPTMTRP